MASYTVTYFADFVHVCASATYQSVLVRCMAWICMRPSLVGWGSPENRCFLAAYPRTQYVPPWDSVPHPENCTFSGMPPTSLLGRMHLHAMHRTNTTLVGSGCKDVHKVGKVRSILYDATRAARAPAINYKSMQLLWGARAIQTMGASVRRAAATHGYRTPHHLTIREQVHRC